MKRGTPDHPKMLALAEALRSSLGDKAALFDLEAFQSLACGIMERLWHFAARYAPSGDLAKFPELHIARRAGWNFDEIPLCALLVEKRWLDRLEGGILYVHDWHDHSDDAADKWLADKGLRYANGEKTRRVPKRTRKSRDKTPTESCQSESSSSSKSESKSKPESEGGARVPADFETPELREALASWAAHYRNKKGEPFDELMKENLMRLARSMNWTPQQFVTNIVGSIANGWMTVRQVDAPKSKSEGSASIKRGLELSRDQR